MDRRGKALTETSRTFLALAPGQSMRVTPVEMARLCQLAARHGIRFSRRILTSGNYRVWREEEMVNG